MNAIAEALTGLVWATMPLRNVLKGEARTQFMESWCKASKALCEGHFKADETPLADPRAAAIRLHRQCLLTCAALGVKPHDLVPQFNDRADSGFLAIGNPTDQLVLLGREAMRTAHALVAAQAAKETV